MQSFRGIKGRPKEAQLDDFTRRRAIGYSEHSTSFAAAISKGTHKSNSRSLGGMQRIEDAVGRRACKTS
jgi:hypothetical protein